MTNVSIQSWQYPEEDCHIFLHTRFDYHPCICHREGCDVKLKHGRFVLLKVEQKWRHKIAELYLIHKGKHVTSCDSESALQRCDDPVKPACSSHAAPGLSVPPANNLRLPGTTMKPTLPPKQLLFHDVCMHEHPGNRFAPSFSCPPTISVISLHHQPWWNWAKKTTKWKDLWVTFPNIWHANCDWGAHPSYMCRNTRVSCYVHAHNWVVITLNGEKCCLHEKLRGN